MKTVNDDGVDEVMLDGRLLHTRVAAAGNARSPIAEWRIGGKMSVDVDAAKKLDTSRSWKRASSWRRRRPGRSQDHGSRMHAE